MKWALRYNGIYSKGSSRITILFLQRGAGSEPMLIADATYSCKL